jgi:hypothetical protein
MKVEYLVIGLLLLSNIAIIGMGEEASEIRETSSINFSIPKIVEEDKYCEIEVSEANSQIFDGGLPILPEYREKIILPFGVTIDNVDFEVHNIQTKVLENKIAPAPHPVVLSNKISMPVKPEMDEDIYESEEFFPANWIDYEVVVGLDENMEHKTFLMISKYPVRYSSKTDTIQYVENIDVTYSYTNSGNDPFPSSSVYDLVIIAPQEFSSALQELVDHKIAKGVPTTLKTTEEIYSQYTGVDKPEKIKYFIKDALETWDMKYVLLVGGLKSLFYAKPRDNANEGTKAWHLPVRYSNLLENEPGYLTDLYYSDIYKVGGEFDDWDSNDDGIFAYWKGFGNKDKLDMYPDVAVGRLACRNVKEVRSIVDKIKKYESGTDPTWFENMVCISGDGFLDMIDLNIQWDTKGLSNGAYTIYAQSENPEGEKGPREEIHIQIDKTQETKLTFNHDDNLRVSTYPAKPMAEIVSVSEGDILGNTDYRYDPKEGEAYCNDHTGWAIVEYKNEILYIRGKSYDPQPYGNVTDLHVWIEDSSGTEVFRDQRLGVEMYYEGEWNTGNTLLKGRAGGAYYMPPEFDIEYLFTSNGKFTGQDDVMNAISKGAGFAFFSGHGSPNVWVNHKPGIPGNRRPADVKGLYGFNFPEIPFYPMSRLSNDYKNPIVVVGGCHNSMFNVSFLLSALDTRNQWHTHCWGIPTAECWSWRLVKVPKGGAIASIGNTGYGFGVLGDDCTIGGLDGGISTEFFVQYGQNGYDVLGETYAMTLTSYMDTFGKSSSGDAQTVQQWVLLGDPSLKIGGY